MESLLKITKIRSRENIKELRMLYNHVENCIRNLKSLKLDTTGYGSLLIPILKDRLPDEVTMVISKKFGKNIWTLDGVMEFFNDELRAQVVFRHPLASNQDLASMIEVRNQVTTPQVVYLVKLVKVYAFIVIRRAFKL